MSQLGRYVPLGSIWVNRVDMSQSGRYESIMSIWVTRIGRSQSGRYESIGSIRINRVDMSHSDRYESIGSIWVNRADMIQSGRYKHSGRYESIGPIWVNRVDLSHSGRYESIGSIWVNRADLSYKCRRIQYCQSSVIVLFSSYYIVMPAITKANLCFLTTRWGSIPHSHFATSIGKPVFCLQKVIYSSFIWILLLYLKKRPSSESHLLDRCHSFSYGRWTIQIWQVWVCG
jgi:hypothetical protein